MLRMMWNFVGIREMVFFVLYEGGLSGNDIFYVK